jgi:hypothetical protein
LEVAKGSVSPRPATSELEQTVDGFDGRGGGVVFEVSEDALDVSSERSREFDKGLQARAATSGYDGRKMLGSILSELVIPHVSEELSDR